MSQFDMNLSLTNSPTIPRGGEITSTSLRAATTPSRNPKSGTIRSAASPSIVSVLGTRHASSPLGISSSGKHSSMTKSGRDDVPFAIHRPRGCGDPNEGNRLKKSRKNKDEKTAHGGTNAKNNISHRGHPTNHGSLPLPLPPTTPKSTRNSRIQGEMRTPPRNISRVVSVDHESPSILRTPLRCCRTLSNEKLRIGSSSKNGKSSTPSFSSDRFIPNREHMRIDLCRASVVSAEKRRVTAIERRAEQVRRTGTGENGDPNPPTPSQPTGEALTPLQLEFRRRMRGALLNVPLEEVGPRWGGGHLRNHATAANSRGNVDGPQSLMDGPTNGGRDDLSNLAYAMLPEDNEADDFSHDDLAASNPNRTAANGGSGGPARILSFRSSASVEDSFVSATSSQASSDLLEDLNSSTVLSSAASSRTAPARSMGMPSATTDPFSHDQLHVLHRTAAAMPLGDYPGGPMSMADPNELAESGLRSVAREFVGRRINAAPTRILDAPELVDDYYLNLVSWGRDNILAVALGQCVYLWDAATGSIRHLLTLSEPEDYVTSVSWAAHEGHTNYIAVGTCSTVQLWDTEALKLVRTLGGHSARVGALDWNRHWLSSGGRDSLIIQHDVRAPNHIASTYYGHTQEVCGLKWNEDGTTLASGGNENYLCLWDAAMSRRNHHRDAQRHNGNTASPRLLLTQHQAAVKALAWCPFHRGLLASGGGTADRTIKFWNTSSGAVLNSIDTGSQVCSLLWSKHQRELCSSHGFSENQLILWRYPTMMKIQEFKGHTARVLHMEQSPDGACVVSAAADETLRFWDVFGTPPNRSKTDNFSFGGFNGGMTSIR